MNTLNQQLITKMGLIRESNVMEKTNELLRLLELKCVNNVPLQVNDCAKIIICADIAASLLFIPIDRDHAIKLSGLRKAQYASVKRVFEKLLDANKILTINDLCIKLNINVMNKKAEELLQIYHQHSGITKDDIMAHPQYVTMAVYLACKSSNKKILKGKCLKYSHLRPTQWQMLEQKWENILKKHYDIDNNDENNEISDKSSYPFVESINIQQNHKTEIEPYEEWKQRMLTLAWQNLKNEQK